MNMTNVSESYRYADGLTVEALSTLRLTALEAEYSDLRLMTLEANHKGISTFETANWVRRMLALQEEIASLLIS